MTTNENNKKKGQFSPHETKIVEEIMANSSNAAAGIKLAAEKLGREPGSVQTKYYKDIRKKQFPNPTEKSPMRLPMQTMTDNNGESMALKGIRALSLKLRSGEERIAAIEYLVEA